MTPRGWGPRMLISHKNIIGSNYVKQDILHFVISYQSDIVAQQPMKQVAPMTFKMEGFTEKMKSKQEWWSS